MPSSVSVNNKLSIMPFTSRTEHRFFLILQFLVMEKAERLELFCRINIVQDRDSSLIAFD